MSQWLMDEIRFWATVCNTCLRLVYCGQTVGWIKMPLGTEVGLGQGDIVLDGDLAPRPRKGAQQPHFSAHVYATAELLLFHLRPKHMYASFVCPRACG